MKPTRATLFRNGGSQAVRLPREFRFPETAREVAVRRSGRKIILEPLGAWPASFLRALGSLTEKLERPPGIPIGKLRDPLE